MKKALMLALLLGGVLSTSAQQTFTKTEHVRFGPDGKKIVFASATYESSATAGVPAKRRSARIGIMNSDGSGLKFVTAETNGVADANPVLSNDGKRIVFRRDNLKDATEAGDIYLINTDGTGLVPLSVKPENEINPEFSIDGNGIIFIREYFVNMGKARDGELVWVAFNGTQEKILVPKTRQVAQAVPLTVGRGGYLLACAETGNDENPLPAGSMLVMASPDGEIAPKSKMVFPGKEKIRIRSFRVVIADGKPVFFVHGTEGAGWFAENVNFKVTGSRVQKLPERGYYTDIALSPDGKSGVSGSESASNVTLWDFSNDQFSNKRILTGKQ